jgi:hypothetical protein
MAEKKSVQQPIDKPLSRAYLREFSGWATAYTPGLSDPTSLRTMENIYITREGAARVRPGIRSVFTEDLWLGTSGDTLVGSFEHFIDTDTLEIALLFAVRGSGGTVTFRVFVYNPATERFDPKDWGVGGDPFAAMSFSAETTYVKYLQIDNKILALSNEADEPAILFNVGVDKSAKKVPANGFNITNPAAHAPSVIHPEAAWINDTTKQRTVAPTLSAETPTTGTLIDSTAGDNTFSYGFFVTYETEFGETVASEVTVIKTQRGWSQWKFNAPDSSGNASTTMVTDARMAMDQLVAMMTQANYDAVKAAGVIKWNLYMFAWSDTTPVPSVATLIGTQEFTASGTFQTESWIQMTASALAESRIVPVPNDNNRENYSGGPLARQGIAVGDRLVLVNDGIDPALIKWSANTPEEYTNMSPSKGGGAKTLSSGNLLVPLSVHLWQNPQSTDTIVILCKGLNGYHAAYYMAPASVSGQSDSTLIMGFEETTATPGTVSPYGNEVYNNALYHTLEASLMKSTAANYTISHKDMTTDIANKWQALAAKDDIVSSQHEGRLYYIVNNPDGEPLEEDCMGNEVWILDVGTDKPTWSRWKVQGISLRKLQIGNKLYMAVVRPDAIFIFDDLMYSDEYAEGADTLLRNIPWKFETNTMGANKQHDAFALVYKMSTHVGDFVGSFRWGVRGTDVYGYPVDGYVKTTHAKQDSTGIDLSNGRIGGGVDLGDTMDEMGVGRDMMEWTFFAESIDGQMFFGQIDYVQFDIAPLSKNIGYENGSIETFEYRRNAVNGMYPGTDVTRNGVPMPMDTSRP